jgi:hypothetical protein
MSIIYYLVYADKKEKLIYCLYIIHIIYIQAHEIANNLGWAAGFRGLLPLNATQY